MQTPRRQSQPVARVPIADSTHHGTGETGASPSAFAHLLKIESDARKTATKRELDALLVNESRIMLRARQVFLFEADGRHTTLKVGSGVSAIDRASPMVQWLEDMVARLRHETQLNKAVEFELPGYASPDDPLSRDYPFRSVLCQPLWTRDRAPEAAILLLRETPWLAAEQQIAQRLAETFGHARTHLNLQRRLPRAGDNGVKYWAWGGAAAAAIALVPVPISVLAPVEVVPRDADVVSMPIDGIVQKILVKPNALVAAGTPLVQLVNTVQRNKSEVAEHEAAVASARVERASSLAFTDPRGRQELGIARAEFALKVAESAFAKEMLAQTIIKAEAAGSTVFSDSRDYEGKPFGVGERLMLVARPGEAELRIALPVADSIVLRPGLKVRAFLDADPLNPANAVLTSVDFQVRVDESQVATYSIIARLSGASKEFIFGSRGTAQIVGERAPLFLYVLRRPLTALRQRLGL